MKNTSHHFIHQILTNDDPDQAIRNATSPDGSRIQMQIEDQPCVLQIEASDTSFAYAEDFAEEFWKNCHMHPVPAYNPGIADWKEIDDSFLITLATHCDGNVTDLSSQQCAKDIVHAEKIAHARKLGLIYGSAGLIAVGGFFLYKKFFGQGKKDQEEVAPLNGSRSTFGAINP